MSVTLRIIDVCVLLGGLFVCAMSSALADEEGQRPGSPPGTYAIAPEASQIQIPFEMFKNDIRMTARVNGKDVRMLIDNGSLWNELLFFGSPRVDALAMESASGVDVEGAGSGEAQAADFVEGISIEFEGLDGRVIEFKDQDAVIMPYDPELANPWEGSEGQVSANFFKHFVVAINFDEGVITLIKPEEFDPTNFGTEVTITPIPRGSWTVPGILTLEDGRVLNVDMVLDLGWDKSFGITTGGAHKIELPQNSERKLLGYGAQGEIFGYKGSLPAIEVFGHKFKDVQSSFSPREDGGSKHEIIVGMGTMNRFNITFDYQNHRVFVRPNESYSLSPEITPSK